MGSVHPTAIVHPNAKLGLNVSVGPYTVIEENVTIGDSCAIMERVHVGSGTTMGRNNVVHMGAVIGNIAQHRAAEVEDSFLKIGDNNVFREYTTVHKSYLKGGSTIVGNGDFFMAFSHIAHDCVIEDNVTVANASLLGGHVHLETNCTISASVALHQYCRVGRSAMVGGMTSITKDVPPYMLVDNGTESVGTLNLIGLKRSGMSEEAVKEIKKAYRLLYLSGLLLPDALAAMQAECKSPEAAHLIDFIKASKRGIIPHRNRKDKDPSLSV